ncbi:MAG: peptidase S1 [Terriglobia bacterium]|nr:MAG: peptidase S1 [Terriglobia bacterium]
MRRFLVLICVATCIRAAEDKSRSLAEFSGELERLAAAVAPAVVQVRVSAWCAPESATRENAATLASCRVVGSGVIVDPSGYIITNEHVVRNARRIRVMLTPKPGADGPAPASKPKDLDSVVVDANRDPVGKREVLDAAVVGANRETDIALLKIEASGLPAIPIRLAARGPRQGQVVLAIGSPEGLDNTMTIGIVSAVGRQPHPDYPMLYIQTDAAINPGNSGGPLLDVHGDLIGINTFMLSDHGGNQGLGFAVPAGVVRYVYQQLRDRGAVRQSLVGVRVQTVTPALAEGLGLSRGYGVMISDVVPDSPAEIAGLRARDIITTVDGASISALPYYTALMYLHDPAGPVAVGVLRGPQTLLFQVPALAVDDRDYRDISIDPRESLIPEFGIFGKNVSSMLALASGLRLDEGIYVMATTAGNEASDTMLLSGDVIVSLNGMPVHSLQELRGAIHDVTTGSPAVLQIERAGQFLYLERELERRQIDSKAEAVRNRQ